MPATLLTQHTSDAAAVTLGARSARDIYAARHLERDAALEFLTEKVKLAREVPHDLPADPALLPHWIAERATQVAQQYRQYLAERKAGAPRQYFANKSHALNFLMGVAPTKLVDGSWLYAMVKQWEDVAFQPLIQTYLEELGDGTPDKNHVVLYRKLLASHGCDDWHHLDDEHFVQGAIQLVLGHHGHELLPEVVGFNLGYEQLPLHLLITSYELNELGIDPYYFTLHVTVDNASTGHARKAAQAVLDLMPKGKAGERFWQRVVDGYLLNELGASTCSVIAGFDLETELLRILAAKSGTGCGLHSDYCRVAGRAVNDWLATPSQMPQFLEALTQAGWIQRGQAVANSRFWRLLEGERAEMFGVFNSYERQVLRDWIEAAPTQAPAQRIQTARARQRALDRLGVDRPQRASGAPRELIRRHRPASLEHLEGSAALHQLEQRVANAHGRREAMRLLTPLMAPEHHHTSEGLMATRMYARLFHA